MKYLVIIITALFSFSCGTIISPEKTPEQLLTEAETLFAEGKYSDALISFETLIENESIEVKAKSYTGLAYVQMRLDQLSDSYASFSNGLSLSTTVAENDLKSGLSALEHSYKKNYQKSIVLSNEILQSNPTFKMMYDSSIDFNDIRLNFAQSYFMIKNYSDCLLEVKRLGKLPNLTINDSEIEYKLAQSLSELASELN